MAVMHSGLKQHKVFDVEPRLFFSELEPCPPGERRRFLDVGCGNGHWCLDMAEEHTEADIIGMDLFDFQSANKYFPRLKFYRPVDLHLPNWPFPEDNFDLARFAHLGGSVRDRRALYQTAYKWD